MCAPPQKKPHRLLRYQPLLFFSTAPTSIYRILNAHIYDILYWEDQPEYSEPIALSANRIAKFVFFVSCLAQSKAVRYFPVYGFKVYSF